MKRKLVLVGVATAGACLAACASILSLDDGRAREGVDSSVPFYDAAVPDTTALDSADVSAPTTCAPLKDFAMVNVVASLNTTSAEEHARLSADELEVFFDSDRLGTFGGSDLYTATRATPNGTWSVPSNLGVGNNSFKTEKQPSLDANGLMLLFASNKSGVFDIWATTRAMPKSPFGAPVAVVSLNTPEQEESPYAANSALTLLASNRGTDAGPLNLYQADEAEAGYLGVVKLNGIDTAGVEDRDGVMTPDGLVLYFSSNRGGGKGGFDIWAATRPTVASAFGAAWDVAAINTPGDDSPGWVSADACRLYFSTNRTAGAADYDIFLGEKVP